MSSYELKKLMGVNVNDNERSVLCGNNTFRYERGTEYMHFFRYADHAKAMIYKFGEIIVRCDIPDELVDQEGFGFYSSEISVLPECIIKKENFDVNFIKGFKYQLTCGWSNPPIPIEEHRGRYIGGYGELYAELFNDLKKQYYKEDPPELINSYIVGKLKGKKLDEVLLGYIDKVDQKHKPNGFSKLFKKR